ncbi:transcriptional coactivator p15/PC4 family protein [Ralstonia sp.]|uniref:transcriptional coactivator p15/PC4 family protein n=1 Tax=Ralstonia sp. TaxID=54061 RepID=UPI0031D0B6ED
MTAAAPTATSFLDLQKNAHQRLRIHVKEYKGLTYVDLRVWFVGENGEYAPSSKGVMLKPSHVVEVAQGLLLASQAAEVKGMG